MTDSTWFLGIDLGTGSCKSVVIDENADILGFGVGEYTGSDAHNRWQEQNPRELLQAAITSVRNALARAEIDPNQCAGLSIGGALHSLLALDRSGEPLTGGITWAETGSGYRLAGRRHLPERGPRAWRTGLILALAAAGFQHGGAQVAVEEGGFGGLGVLGWLTWGRPQLRGIGRRLGICGLVVGASEEQGQHDGQQQEPGWAGYSGTGVYIVTLLLILP